MKEDLTQIDELINPNINLPFGGDRITHNHGGSAPFLVELLRLVSEAKHGNGANRKKKKEEEEEKKEKTRRRKEKTIQNNQ